MHATLMGAAEATRMPTVQLSAIARTSTGNGRQLCVLRYCFIFSPIGQGACDIAVLETPSHHLGSVSRAYYFGPPVRTSMCFLSLYGAATGPMYEVAATTLSYHFLLTPLGLLWM